MDIHDSALSTEDQLFEDIFLVACLMHRDVLKAHYDYDRGELTRLHFGTLGALSTCQPVTTSELAYKMQVAKPQMTVLLDKLENVGLVRRQADANDRRRVLISMTDTGTKALREATANMGKSMKQKLRTLEATDLHELSRSLKSLAAIFAKLPQEEIK